MGRKGNKWKRAEGEEELDKPETGQYHDEVNALFLAAVCTCLGTIVNESTWGDTDGPTRVMHSHVCTCKYNHVHASTKCALCTLLNILGPTLVHRHPRSL
jgi:hypothetical protein